MESNTLPYIPVTATLKSHIVINKIIETIAQQVRDIHNFESLQRNLDVVLYICNMIENLCFENRLDRPKGYKQDIAIKVFEKLNWTKPEDRDFLINSINFLHSCGKIKRIAFVKRLLGYFRAFLKLLM